MSHGKTTQAQCGGRVVSYHRAWYVAEAIFEDDRDRKNFVELLALMVERYCVVSGDAISPLRGALSGMRADGVSKAVQRMRSRLSVDKKLNRILRKVVLALNEKG